MTTMASTKFSSTQPLFGCSCPVGTGNAPLPIAEGLIEKPMCLGNALHDNKASGVSGDGWVVSGFTGLGVHGSQFELLLGEVVSHLLLLCGQCCSVLLLMSCLLHVEGRRDMICEAWSMCMCRSCS